MRILFDHGTPAPLRRALTAHSVSTAYEMGWTELDNGALLQAAEAEFDVLITTDQNLRYQQNLSGRRLAILVLPTNEPLICRRHRRVAPWRPDGVNVLLTVPPLRAGHGGAAEPRSPSGPLFRPVRSMNSCQQLRAGSCFCSILYRPPTGRGTPPRLPPPLPSPVASRNKRVLTVYSSGCAAFEHPADPRRTAP
jgi:hypothetical protein